MKRKDKPEGFTKRRRRRSEDRLSDNQHNKGQRRWVKARRRVKRALLSR